MTKGRPSNLELRFHPTQFCCLPHSLFHNLCEVIKLILDSKHHAKKQKQSSLSDRCYVEPFVRECQGAAV